ncbi:hypothetical protein [Ruficoccus sp. ZRK36]|uniref:hypothetical protein n=1 Tax=Ruficoccus sp. ZRK36 TaxID=2866311 RepID=UPI001C73118A|nr:hypothetical protein [Ruficoccus sp. ZRK36]QYY35733.1 hypothetical protein K0V07_15715 [Ruficoccus sp. ZRK36]
MSESQESSGPTSQGLLSWLKPWVRLDSRFTSWEEGEEVHSRKILVRTRPGVQLDLLQERDHPRFSAKLSKLDDARGYYQLKVWPHSTREFAQGEVRLLATLPNGREKLYKVQACVD